MADFTSSGWSLYIAIVTIASILFCLWLALALAKGKVKGQEVGTTGHKWDEDLEEFNNPLPRWWLWLFILTCVFSVVYLILYPGLGSFAGAVVGGLLLGLIESVAPIFVPNATVDILSFLIVMVVLAVRPRGLLGRA